MRKLVQAGLVGVLLSGTVVGGASPAAADRWDLMAVSAVDFAFTNAPSTADAGRYKIALTNNSTLGRPHEFVVLELQPGVSTDLSVARTKLDEAITAGSQGDPNYFAGFAGAAFAPAGETSNGGHKLVLEEGRTYLYFCAIRPNQTSPVGAHYNRGMIGFLSGT